jgi:hypothetical protein
VIANTRAGGAYPIAGGPTATTLIAGDLAPAALAVGRLAPAGLFGGCVGLSQLWRPDAGPATIDDPRVVRRILTHLGLLGDAGPPGPPAWRAI